MEAKNNIYDLSRNWFDFCFENPDKIKPNHTALYFFCIEHCNRLGWKDKFGLPTTMAKEAIGVHSYNTYISTLNDLVSFGFIKMIQKSKNQYSSNIIELSNFNKALDKALDKAFIKHDTKQSESTEQSIDSIIIQLYKYTKDQFTKDNISALRKLIESDDKFNFKNELLKLGVELNIANDWLTVRKNKKGSNTETAFNKIKSEIEKSRISPNECIKYAVIKNWVGFEASWIKDDFKKDIVEDSEMTHQELKKHLWNNHLIQMSEIDYLSFEQLMANYKSGKYPKK